MKAVVVYKAGDSKQLVLTEVPKPKVVAGMVAC